MSTRDDTVERIIPLPKEVAISGFRTVEPGELRLSCVPAEAANEPRVAAALRLLGEAGIRKGKEGGSFHFQLRLAGAPGKPPETTAVSSRIASLPNPAQAYAIVPDDERPERMRALYLLANGPLGVLYAVRTLLQLLQPHDGAGELSLPCARIVDWPDVEERGQWGGNTHDEVDWTARWKLNVVEESVGLSVDAAGRTRLALSQEHISHAHTVGVSIVPYVLHLEQVALYAGLMSRTDIISTPDPSVPLPAEHVPGLCMSSPATVALVGDWMELIAGYEHIGAIEVWLSEDRAACFCPRCSGTEPFELEVRCIQEAFRRARARKSDLKLRILLTQGSYAVNDKVIAAADRDVQITYYDGGRTYDSSHAQMIYPLLEQYARSGRWLGVYPQITHCWRTVFPWSAPQLIAFRAREFAEKGLSNVTGYAVPSNRHHELNVMALAEWTWNSRGRSPEAFARAYARRSGIERVEEFGRWAVAAGEAGWWLAESRMLLRFIYNYDVDVSVGQLVEDHRFRHAGVSYDRPAIEGALLRAKEAREISRAIGLAPLVEESDAVYAGLAALLALDDLHASVGKPRDSEQLAETLDRLDRASAVLCRSVSSWGERINALIPPSSPAVGSIWVRLRDTANVLFRVCDTLRRKEELRRVPDASASRRERRLGAWSARDFDSEALARLSFDVTEALEGERGHTFVCFTYGKGQYAAEIRSVSLRRTSGGSGGEVLSRTGDAPMRVGRWEKWHELKLGLPERAAGGGRLRVEVEIVAVILGGRRAEAWECSGEIGLRTAWPEDTRV